MNRDEIVGRLARGLGGPRGGGRQALELKVRRAFAADPDLGKAFDLGFELLEQHYVDKHIVTFTEHGYALEHPIHCRRDMTGCVYQEWLASELGPACDPGRYIMRWINNQARYTPLEI